MTSPSNQTPKTKTFLMAKESFLNALENAKRCSRSFKKKCSEQPDEHDKALLGFIKTVVRSFPKDAEEIPRTREKIMSRKIQRNINTPKPTVASSALSLNAPTDVATEPSNVLPATVSNTTTLTPLSPQSSPAPTPTLTPTGARRPIPDAIEVVVEMSATGQGKHTIWKYPGDKARAQAAPMTPTSAPVCASFPGVIVKPSATGLGTHTIWLDTADPASGKAETDATLKPSVEFHNLSNTTVTPSGRRVVVRDPRSSSPCSNGSSASPRLTRTQKFRARYRSPTPYPMATRPAPPPPTRKPETPESHKSKKRSRDIDNDEEATRPRKRSSQESFASRSTSVTRSGTPLSIQGSPVPRRSERRGRSNNRGKKGKDSLKDN